MEFMVKMIVYDETMTFIYFYIDFYEKMFDPGMIRGPSRHRESILFDQTFDF